MREEDDDDLIDTGIRTVFKYSKKIFGDINPRYYFSKKNQRLNNLLIGNNFMARGHLAPAADFFLACERWATFSLSNVVPQWQTHNNGRWKAIENLARHLDGAAIAETGPYYKSPKKFLDSERSLFPIPHFLYKKVWDEKGVLLLDALDIVDI
uniref:DNA/RNA non-specific endonuclease/pyrophosphatase/phosphodiesterase domain-containing protein n=1 Tax=Chionoecetes opilio bacilliform virus TaxID=1825681 RepID=A0A1Q3DLJ3_9VIRU|nr:hypothetical protein SCV_129 [Chionoecetes opilio bacilliform virus]